MGEPLLGDLGVTVLEAPGLGLELEKESAFVVVSKVHTVKRTAARLVLMGAV